MPTSFKSLQWREDIPTIRWVAELPFTTNAYFVARVTADMIIAHQHMPQSQHWKDSSFIWGRVNEYAPKDPCRACESLEAGQQAAQDEFARTMSQWIDE